MRKSLAVLWIMLCAGVLPGLDYEARTVKVQPIESYPARTSLGAITIAADPYSTNKKSSTAFDIKDLNSRGYFPIHILIKNESMSFFKIRARDVILITAAGQHLYSTPTTVVVVDVFDSSSTRSNSPLSDFTDKDIANKTVDPGRITDGFLFFYNADRKKNIFEGGTLYIPKLEEEGTRKIIGPFSIPLDPALTAPK